MNHIAFEAGRNAAIPLLKDVPRGIAPCEWLRQRRPKPQWDDDIGFRCGYEIVVACLDPTCPAALRAAELLDEEGVPFWPRSGRT